MIRRLLLDQHGVTAVEFALLAPVLLISLMGCFDLGHNMYTNGMLVGAIQKTARDSSIEGASGNEAALDQHVAEVVHAIAPSATLTFTRKAYTNFGDVSQPEDYTDVNANNICDNGEPFEDANGNGAWDADRGSSGFGGARDAVLYTVDVTYDRLFPLAGLIGQPPTMTVSAATVLRNQPYGQQGQPAVTQGACA